MSELAAAAASYTVRDLFQRAFRIYGPRVAVTDENGSWTYAELGDQSSRLAAALHGLGLRQGDRVAVLSETRPEYVAAYAALASLGITALTLNIRMHPDELRYCIESGKPAALLASGPLTPLVRGLRAGGGSTVRSWICFDGPQDGFLDYAQLLAGAGQPPLEADVRAGDVHNVLYTSGTTGRPKGAMISHGAAATRGLRLAQWFGLGPDDGFIGWLPLFHCGGDESLYATMITGGRFGALRKAGAETMFAMIERDRLSWTLLLPGVITDFLHHPRRGDYDLSSFRFAIGYANMMPNVVQQLTAACGIDFYDAFGQTESSYLLAHGVSRPGEAPTLRKLPSPMLDVRIVSDDMTEAPVGQPGECVVRGPSVMSGYLDDPAATEEAFRGGWLHTGDLLMRHEDGTLTFVDRKKYLIKTGGENVYPAEVEQVIAAHPAVQEVCVFGVPDARWGETVKAAVVLRPGAELTAATLDAWCRERLAGYKRPRYIAFLAPGELPRSTTGKVQRHELARRPARDEGTGMSPGDILVRQEGAARVLIINRPARRNAMTRATAEGLRRELDQAAADPETGAVVLTGADGHFSAGADGADILAASGAGEQGATRLMHAFHQLVETVWAAALPVVAAVSGVAYGGGFNLALACDLVVCSADTRFCQVFVRRGLVPDLGGAYLLPRLVGMQRAKQLMLLAPEIDAASALQLGLVNAVLPDPQQALEHALALAAELADGQRTAIAQAKRLLNASTGGTLQESLSLEAEIQAALLRSEPVQRSFRDFLAGR